MRRAAACSAGLCSVQAVQSQHHAYAAGLQAAMDAHKTNFRTCDSMLHLAATATCTCSIRLPIAPGCQHAQPLCMHYDSKCIMLH
jgi:hypothetical protein